MSKPVEIRPMPVRDMARCIFLLALIFAVAALAGCKMPEASYVAADAQTLKALERPLTERIADERARGDGEQAWIWENTLESWRDRVKDAMQTQPKAPSEPPKPNPAPPRDGPVPATATPRPR